MSWVNRVRSWSPLRQVVLSQSWRHCDSPPAGGIHQVEYGRGAHSVICGIDRCG